MLSSLFFFLFSFLLFVYSRAEDLSFFLSLTQTNSLSYAHRSLAEKWRSAFYTDRPTCFFFVLVWLVLFYCSDFIRLMRKIVFVFQIFWLCFEFLFWLWYVLVFCAKFRCLVVVLGLVVIFCFLLILPRWVVVDVGRGYLGKSAFTALFSLETPKVRLVQNFKSQFFSLNFKSQFFSFCQPHGSLSALVSHMVAINS